VFGSAWFAAIYLLLFVSLVGCLVPRIRMHARAVLRKPLPAPRNLDRLPEHGSFAAPARPDQAADAARATLGRRWRVVRRDEPGGAITLSAEKGYSRETGNLIFHIALLAALLLIGIGRLYAYQGTRIVMQGADRGFCNVVAQYDSWRPGRFAAEGKVSPAPFCIDEMSKFTATYTASGEPSEFRADLTYTADPKAANPPLHRAVVTVNHPLRLEGDRVYLIGHGYAPQVTITMPNGEVRHDTEVFVPSNAATLYSEGAFKQPGPDDRKQDIGISGFFAPTPVSTGNGIVSSASPQVRDPVLGIIAYRGDLTGSGEAQSVYALDTTKMTKIGMKNLAIGQTAKFPGGVSVRFDGWVPWASLQVSHDPAQTYLLIAAVAMVLGLIGSLGIRRRRVWLRLRPGADSSTVVEVGGLARSDSGNFTTEFAALLQRLSDAGTQAPGAASAAAERETVGVGKD
jgi:cytochrome c biogenesis protein